MKNWIKSYWSNCLSIAAIICSVVAICVSLPSVPELGIDYIGVIVGILSLLVTMLIGWQIYNVITIDKKIDGKIEQVSNYLSNNIKEINKETLEHIQKKNDQMEEYILVSFDLMRSEYFSINKKYKSALFSYLRVISQLSESTSEEKLSMIDLCFEKIKEIYSFTNKDMFKSLNDEDRAFYIKSLLKIDHEMALDIILLLRESQNKTPKT